MKNSLKIVTLKVKNRNRMKDSGGLDINTIKLLDYKDYRDSAVVFFRGFWRGRSGVVIMKIDRNSLTSKIKLRTI